MASATRSDQFRSSSLTACLLAVYASPRRRREATLATACRYGFGRAVLAPVDSYKEFHCFITDPPFPRLAQRERLWPSVALPCTPESCHSQTNAYSVRVATGSGQLSSNVERLVGEVALSKATTRLDRMLQVADLAHPSRTKKRAIVARRGR